MTWGAVVDDGPVTYSVYVDEAATPVESGLTDLTYTVAGLGDDTDYVVEVTATDAAGNESVRSTPESATTNDDAAPLAPSNVQAAGGDQEVIVTWDAVTDDDPVTYNVFQAGLVDPVATGLTDATFTVTGLEAETEYSFTVTAVDPSGNESDESEAASATTDPVVDTTAPEVPVVSSAIAGDGRVVVSWDPVADAAGDLAGYNVYVDGVESNVRARGGRGVRGVRD